MLPSPRHGPSFARPGGITAQLIHAADGFHLWSETYDRKLDEVFREAFVRARGADNAFAWLDKTVESKGPGLSDMVTEDLFQEISSKPRWLPFLRKIRNAPEQNATIEFYATLPA